VHHDGLVHVSQLSHKFVTDAREVVKTGDIVRVQVMEVDVARKRISLTMKLGSAAGKPGDELDSRLQRDRIFGPARLRGQAAVPASGATAMSSAFARVKGVQR
jgi:uncharacterized protein